MSASAKELLAGWQCPPSAYRSAPFWSWNGLLSPERLCRQIEALQRAGMGGFFMHSRYGLKTPYLSREWFECVGACVEKARALGMKAYLYDEDRWPSGFAGGAATRKNPEFRLHSLRAVPAGSAGDSGERLALLAVKRDPQGRVLSWRPVEGPAAAGEGEAVIAFDVVIAAPTPRFNDAAYLDTMNPQAVAEFLRLTHQAYADRLGKDFGDLVPAIFTDEPNYGHHVREEKTGALRVPWTPLLAREFLRRRGYDLLEHLPEIFFPLAAGEFSLARHDYHRTITELFVENWSAQIGRWCQKHGILLTGHMLSEQTLAHQVAVIGAAMPHYEHMQWPGIDVLCDQADELATAKQCASVADQLGRERVLSELYGCTGWDWPLEGHKFVGDWQYACGVNFRCPHLTHYSLAGGGKRDYPASLYAHSPWWRRYPLVEDYFGRLSYLLTRGAPVRDVLVIHPVESAWGAFLPSGQAHKPDPSSLQEPLDRILYGLMGHHYDWDFGDEGLLERHAKAAAAGLGVGKMTYRLVVVPPCITLRSATAKLLKKHLSAGGKVLFIGRRPERIDGKPTAELAGLLASAASCGDRAEEFLPAVESLLPRRVGIAEDGKELSCVWAMLRSLKPGQLLFLQSHDRKAGHRVRVSLPGRPPAILWDALTGELRKLPSRPDGERIEFELDLPPTGSALVSLGLTTRGAAAPEQPPKVLASRAVEGPFDYELAEPNTMPLDYCRFRVGEGAFSEPVPVLKADKLIRKHFGLAPRSASGCQPWYLYATGVEDTAPRGRCQLRWTFHATAVPAACRLAMENPQDYRITVNGGPAGPVDGWWVDEDIRTIDIARQLRIGENEVLLDFDYRANMELEDAYLVGDFGVAARAAGPLAPGNVTLVEPPRRLALGSWRGQGLDFYGGAVRYKLALDHPGPSKHLRLRLNVACTAAAIEVGGG